MPDRLRIGGALARVLAGVTACLALGVAPAHGAVTLLNGPTATTEAANCNPMQFRVSYSQQDGQNPKVGDVFYLSFQSTFIGSFDCAADFSSQLATLPAGVQPVSGTGAVPVCRRFGMNANGQFVYDPRAVSNCPASVAFNTSTRQFSMRPIPAPSLPDIGGQGGSFWFQGIRSPQESQEYPGLQLLVPLVATSPVAAQSMSVFLCTVGTSCATASVGLTVGAAPAPADPPVVSLPPGLQTTATGAKVPFSVNGGTTPYRVRIDTATAPDYSARPCGGPFDYVQNPGGGDFTGDFESAAFYGDLAPVGSCTLAPNTDYFFKVCAIRSSDAFVYGCRETQFHTGAVSSTLAGPAETAVDRPRSDQFKVAYQVLGGHPAGTGSVQVALKPSTTFTQAASTAISAAAGSTTPVTLTVGTAGVSPWRTHQVRACFGATCGTPIDVFAGYVIASAATQVTASSAQLRALPLAPYPFGRLQFRVGTSDPGTANPATALPLASSIDLNAFSGTGGTPSAQVVADLTPGTQHWWAACFDVSAETGVEDCSDPQTFTTGLPAEHVVTSEGVGGVGQDGATLAARVTGPHTAGSLSWNVGKVGEALVPRGDTRVVAAAGTTSGAFSTTITGLEPDTEYVAQAVFSSSSLAPAFAASQRFRTAAVPVTDPPPTTPTTPPSAPPTPPVTSTPAGPAVTTPTTPVGVIAASDRTRPAAKLVVSGAVRRGRTVTLRVTASDASGIRSITVRLGAGRTRPYPKRGVRIALGRKPVKITVRVTDRAGNVRILTKTLTPRR